MRKLSEGSCYLACWGLNFPPLDCAAWMLGAEEDLNNAVVSQGFSILLSAAESVQVFGENIKLSRIAAVPQAHI